MSLAISIFNVWLGGAIIGMTIITTIVRGREFIQLPMGVIGLALTSGGIGGILS